MELAVGEPVILGGEAGAVLQIDDGIGGGLLILVGDAGIIGAGIIGGRILPVAGRRLLRRAFVGILRSDVETGRRVVAVIVSLAHIAIAAEVITVTEIAETVKAEWRKAAAPKRSNPERIAAKAGTEKSKGWTEK